MYKVAHKASQLFCYTVLVFLISCSFANDTSSKKQDSEESDELKLRVMAYNIHHANPPSKPEYIDIDAIVKVIKAADPDILALQEVDVNIPRSGAINEAEVIAEQLNMNVFFGKAIDYHGGEYGVAILSKYPMSEEVVHKLPTKAETNGEPRVLATAKIKLSDGTVIRFGSTHLDAQKSSVNRELQINKIAKIASNEHLPFIIAGDFNATPGSEVIRVLDNHFQRTCSDCSPTIPVNEPKKAIDFIAYKHPLKQFSVVSHEVIDEKYASDHLPILSVLSYKKAEQSPVFKLSSKEEEEGFKVLFDGTHLDNWQGNKTDYIIEHGNLVVRPQKGSKGNLFTNEQYADFVMRFQFQLMPGANNGLSIRAPLKEDAAYAGIELQILDNTAEKYKELDDYQYHGSVYGLIPAKRGHLKPVGQWNDQEVIVKGSQVKVILNGEVIVDGNIEKALEAKEQKNNAKWHRKKGHLGFLGHGSVVKFRNIRVKDITETL